VGRKKVQKKEQQKDENAGTVSPVFLSIQDLSGYLGIKTSTLYAMVGEKKVPHYKIGRLVRFRRSEIELWMEGNRKECLAPEKPTRETPGQAQRNEIDIDRIVRKAVDGGKGRGYTTPHGKPDQVKGLGKEV
jgi:excisionase family DNA binding protein